MITHPALARRRHGFFSRQGGVSEGGFASLNCSDRSDDEPMRVSENRGLASEALGYRPEALMAVHQVHGTAVAVLDAPWSTRPVADALVTARPGLLLGIVAVVGPCIAQASYEVGADLRDAVLARDPADGAFFTAGLAGHWHFDLPGYCLARLAAAGAAGHATGDDTLGDPARFFSHRRRTLGREGPIGHQLSAIGL